MGRLILNTLLVFTRCNTLLMQKESKLKTFLSPLDSPNISTFMPNILVLKPSLIIKKSPNNATLSSLPLPPPSTTGYSPNSKPTSKHELISTPPSKATAPRTPAPSPSSIRNLSTNCLKLKNKKKAKHKISYWNKPPRKSSPRSRRYLLSNAGSNLTDSFCLHFNLWYHWGKI